MWLKFNIIINFSESESDSDSVKLYILTWINVDSESGSDNSENLIDLESVRINSESEIQSESLTESMQQLTQNVWLWVSDHWISESLLSARTLSETLSLESDSHEF